MTRMVIGTVLLLAAMVSPDVRPSPPAPPRIARFLPVSGATARATASVRIVSGVRFGGGTSGDISGAMRRTVELAERDGAIRSTELLEFQ